jgi:hypothetical protein
VNLDLSRTVGAYLAVARCLELRGERDRAAATLESLAASFRSWEKDDFEQLRRLLVNQNQFRQRLGLTVATDPKNFVWLRLAVQTRIKQLAGSMKS